MNCSNCSQPRLAHKHDRCPDGSGWFKERSCPGMGGKKCDKMTDGETAYCPKHRVLIEGQAMENEKKMQKLRDRKSFKAEMRKALETSPLSGYNPKFDENRRSGYER